MMTWNGPRSNQHSAYTKRKITHTLTEHKTWSCTTSQQLEYIHIFCYYVFKNVITIIKSIDNGNEQKIKMKTQQLVQQKN